eukprot:4652011-Pyramimonas_sp.AAC.1
MRPTLQRQHHFETPETCRSKTLNNIIVRRSVAEEVRTRPRASRAKALRMTRVQEGKEGEERSGTV